MPHRRHEPSQDHHSYGHQSRKGLSQWTRRRDLDEDYDDYRGRQPGHDNYQFDRDPISFDQSRGRDYRQSRGSSSHFADQSQDYGYNYPGSATAGYGAYQGSPGSGYGSYSGTAGSNYGSYQSDFSPTQGRQNLNPGFQHDQNYSRREDLGRYEGTGATDQYEGLSTGFSGPYKNERSTPYYDRTATSSRQTTSPGRFTGQGPKGYRRSDERIQDDVCYALMQAPHVDASQIEVQVEQGVVTLTGTVSDRSMKRMAEDCVENVQGVSDVHNQLRTQSSQGWSQSGSGASTSATGTSSSTGLGMSSSQSSSSDFAQDSKSRQSSKRS